MKAKTITKIVTDIVMTIALLLLMAYQLIGEEAHELIGSMVSGIVLSRYVFAPLNVHGGASWAVGLHILCAYWGFVIMSIHLGFHWNMVTAMAGRMNLKTSVVITVRMAAVLIALYGAFAFVKRDFWNYMILKNHFAFYDFSEPVIFFLLDYFAVMGLFVFAGHCLSKMMSSVRP